MVVIFHSLMFTREYFTTFPDEKMSGLFYKMGLISRMHQPSLTTARLAAINRDWSCGPFARRMYRKQWPHHKLSNMVIGIAMMMMMMMMLMMMLMMMIIIKITIHLNHIPLL